MVPYGIGTFGSRSQAVGGTVLVMAGVGGGASEFAEGAAEGTLCVDMSTIAPGDSRRIAAEESLAELGIRLQPASAGAR